MKVAILGTGSMGGAMAGTLTAAGHDVVVFNRTGSRAEEVAARTGAAVRATPREAVADAEVAISMLADRAAVEDVYRGDDGVLAGLPAGAVACEMSTIEPVVAPELGAIARDRGAGLLDAPVSGSVPAVEAGTLTIMVGGDAEHLDTARPVLMALASRVFHLGGLGAGAAMKLAVNAVVHALNQAVSEALVLAETAGIPREDAYEVLASSAVGAPFLDYKRAAFERPEEAGVAFRLALARKDLELITAFSQQLGVPMAQAATNLEVAADASRDLGERDMSALAVHVRRRVRTDAAGGSAAR